MSSSAGALRPRPAATTTTTTSREDAANRRISRSSASRLAHVRSKYARFAARPASHDLLGFRVLDVMRRRVIVHGRVQGVFFRDTTRRMAQSRGVSGWVRNNPDGTVEAAFEGERDAVDAMVQFVREGPRGAVVENVEVIDEDPERLTGFRVE